MKQSPFLWYNALINLLLRPAKHAALVAFMRTSTYLEKVEYIRKHAFDYSMNISEKRELMALLHPDNLTVARAKQLGFKPYTCRIGNEIKPMWAMPLWYIACLPNWYSMHRMEYVPDRMYKFEPEKAQVTTYPYEWWVNDPLKKQHQPYGETLPYVISIKK